MLLLDIEILINRNIKDLYFIALNLKRVFKNENYFLEIKIL